MNALNKSPQYDPFTKQSFLSLLFSMVLNLSDYASDIVVAVLLYNEKDTDWWFALTVLLIFIPLILVNLFSIFWYHQVSIFIIFLLLIFFMPFSPFFRITIGKEIQ